MECPNCNGKLKKTMIQETMHGENLGEYQAMQCETCKETYTDEETTKKIEEKAKEKGVWGLGRKSKIAKTGNSLAIRIPRQIAERLQLKEGSEIYISPEKDKIIIDKTS